MTPGPTLTELNLDYHAALAALAEKMKSAQPGSILENGELPRTHAPASLEDYFTHRTRNKHRTSNARQTADHPRPSDDRDFAQGVNSPASTQPPLQSTPNLARQPVPVTPIIPTAQMKSRNGASDDAMLTVPADPWTADGEFRQWLRGDGSVRVYQWQLGEWKWLDLGVIEGQNVRALHELEEQSFRDPRYFLADGSFNRKLFQTHLEMVIYQMCTGDTNFSPPSRTVPNTPLPSAAKIGKSSMDGNASAQSPATSPEDVPRMPLPSATTSTSSHIPPLFTQHRGLGARPAMVHPDPFASQAPAGLDPRAATWPRQPSWKEQQAHRSELARLQQEQARRELEAHRASLAGRFTTSSPILLSQSPLSTNPSHESLLNQPAPSSSQRDELRRTVLHDPFSTTATSPSALSSVFAAPPGLSMPTAANKDFARGFSMDTHLAPGVQRTLLPDAGSTGPLPTFRHFPTAGDGKDYYGSICDRSAEKKMDTAKWWMSGLDGFQSVKERAALVASNAHDSADAETIRTTAQVMLLAHNCFQGYYDTSKNAVTPSAPVQRPYFDTFTPTGTTLMDHLRSVERRSMSSMWDIAHSDKDSAEPTAQYAPEHLRGR